MCNQLLYLVIFGYTVTGRLFIEQHLVCYNTTQYSQLGWIYYYRTQHRQGPSQYVHVCRSLGHKG